LMRLAAKMRPSKRSPRRLPIASRQLSAVKPSRSKIPASSAEIQPISLERSPCESSCGAIASYCTQYQKIRRGRSSCLSLKINIAMG
jgi:hypothetical protein